MPEPVHIDRIPDDQHNPVPTTLAPSLWWRGLMATGIAAAINAVGFHIVNAAGANMSVATARMEMVLTIAPVLAPTAFPTDPIRHEVASRVGGLLWSRPESN